MPASRVGQPASRSFPVRSNKKEQAKLEDDRALAVDQDAVVEVGHHGTGEDEALDVAADADHVGDLVAGMSYLVRRLLENTSNDSFLLSRSRGIDLDQLLAKP